MCDLKPLDPNIETVTFFWCVINSPKNLKQIV